VNVTTANQYMQVDTQSDPYVALNVGDGALFRNQNASAFLTMGPSCGRELQGRASLVIREVGYGNGYTEVEGGSGADLVPGGTCACAALVEQKAGVPLWWVPIAAVGIGAGVLCAAGELGCDDDDPVSPD
jgi:hypothetical protein